MKRFDVWTCTQTWINHFQECILHAMLISEYRNCENLMNVLAWNVYNNASFHKCFTSYQFFWKAKVFPFDLNRSSCTVFQTSTFHMCKYFVPHFCDAWHENYFGQQQKHGKKHRKSPRIIFVREVVRREKKVGPMTVTQQHKYRSKQYSRKSLWSYLLFLEWDRSKTYNNNPLSIDWRTDDTMRNERF